MVKKCMQILHIVKPLNLNMGNYRLQTGTWGTDTTYVTGMQKKIKKLRIRKKMNVRYCLIKKIHVINLASYDAFEITNL